METHAPFEDGPDVELVGDRAEVGIPSLEGKGRGTTGDLDLSPNWYLREVFSGTSLPAEYLESFNLAGP